MSCNGGKLDGPAEKSQICWRYILISKLGDKLISGKHADVVSKIKKIKEFNPGGHLINLILR